MKKTLLTVLAPCVCGLASGSTVVTISNDNPAWATDSLGIYAAIPSAGPTSKDNNAFAKTLNDGTDLAIKITSDTAARIRANSGTTFDITGWTNTAAFTDMNAALGTSLAVENFSGLKYVTSGAGGSRSGISLTLDSSISGKEVVFYLALSAGDSDATDSVLTTLVVSGLDNASVSYATATGNGFVSTLNTSEAGYQKLTLAKVTGTVTDTVLFTDNTNKNGWGMVAWSEVTKPAVPEPATATLSLLALAGLAARRRRK